MEERVFKENLREAKKERPRLDHGTGYGVSSIIFGLAAVLLPHLAGVMAATIGATLAVVSHHHGDRRLSVIGALLVLLGFFLSAGQAASCMAGMKGPYLCFW